MKQQTKHTPGPWRYTPSSEGGTRMCTVETGRTTFQCSIHQADGGADADARLIAAAPDCLAALDEIAQLAHNGGFPDMSADELRKLLFSCGNRAMIAIAKATGGAE